MTDSHTHGYDILCSFVSGRWMDGTSLAGPRKSL